MGLLLLFSLVSLVLVSHHLLHPDLNPSLQSYLHPLLSPPLSLDGGGRPRQDGGVRLPVGAGRDGAAGEPEGRVSSLLCRQTGTLAGKDVPP